MRRPNSMSDPASPMPRQQTHFGIGSAASADLYSDTSRFKTEIETIYEPRIVADHVMVQEDFERLHKFLLETDDFSDITDDRGDRRRMA